MERLSDSDHPLVRQTALRLTEASLEVRDKLLKLFLYGHDGIAFRAPENGDYVKASETIRLGYGQCNTKATLSLALCTAIGLPTRILFSLIKRNIQKGYFTGIAYWLMLRETSRSWIEVEIDGQWRRIDSFINALALYEAAQTELKRRRWSTGFSLALSDEEVPQTSTWTGRCTSRSPL